MSDIPTARHLAAITREAAGRAYESDAGTAGKIATWLITILTTLHAGGLLAAIQFENNLARPYEAQCALLVGLVVTILGAIFALVHYNALAERWRLEMHYEIEGVKKIAEATDEHTLIAARADNIATGLAVLSIIALGLAGVFAI
jgi:multisubunit Na+/H+ antiporter MnhB subunit